MEKQKVKNILKNFRKEKVMQISSLVSLLQCSTPTVRNRLKEWKVLNSCNKNGSYYVLPDIPQFNKNGLWRFKNTLFSQFGNLKSTILNLVERSSSGLNAIEMNEILLMNVIPFLSQLKDHPRLQRIKYQGVYIYFSREQDFFEKQKREREKVLQSLAGIDLPRDIDSITILVKLIKHPKDTVEGLTRRVRRQGLNISKEKVHNLLLFHGLLKKNRV